ncbi:MAG: DUF4954 family protein, partial [Spirochaetota bacterium]
MQRMYRELTREEIVVMERSGCQSESWDKVKVSEGFDASRVQRSSFSGAIYIGRTEGTVTLAGDITLKTGIYDAVLHNVTVGDDVLIRNIDRYIANYVIQDYAVLYEVHSLIVNGVSAFGNGVEAAVINESGGREVPIFDRLTSQNAYLMAVYRYRPKMIERMQDFIDTYVDSVSSDMGEIGTYARLLGCGPIMDVRIGPWAQVEGVVKLKNCTINSCREDPALVGLDVVAEDCIFAEGSKVTDGVIAEKCYIGQGTELSKQYSAENSLFFANCAGHHGEACSLFAGPFTVTHHKSTLLIAALVSFLNAGSGSNQSNHMYKLGPNHQGVLERGSKTASDSYMLFPMHVGAFTVVMGRHYNNSDTSELPFSYLIEHEGESLLIPGVSLRSVGTLRDARKWPQRDKRKTSVKDDLIIYNLLTPFTVEHIIEGQKKLHEIRDQAGHSSIHYFYNGVRLSKSALERGLEIYELALRRYLGNIVVNHLRAADLSTEQAVLEAIKPRTKVGVGRWLDISGLIVPKEVIDRLIHDIETGSVASLQEINQRMEHTYEHFREYELAWVINQICKKKHKQFEDLTIADVKNMIENWIEAATELDQMRCRDAEKEFAVTAKVGYGLNGTSHDRDYEYQIIHGTPEENNFVLDLQRRMKAKQKTARE